MWEVVLGKGSLGDAVSRDWWMRREGLKGGVTYGEKLDS